MAVKLRCPDCRQTFPWATDTAWPRFCPLCSADINNDRADDDVVMPFIRTSGATAATDKVYRDIERGSEIRAQAAADMTGASVAEMADLKITDLKSTKHQGDIAAPPLPQHLQNVGSFGGSNGSQYSPAVQQGPFPNAGAHMRSMIQNNHGEAVQRHCVGVDAYTRQPVVPRSDVVSERPALETQQPGYRYRA